jgi:hypothetical protein
MWIEGKLPPAGQPCMLSTDSGLLIYREGLDVAKILYPGGLLVIANTPYTSLIASLVSGGRIRADKKEEHT